MKYEFDGRIGEELVKLEQAGAGFGVDTYILTVTRPDGITIEYFNESLTNLRDLKMYKGKFAFYHYDGTDEGILDEARRQFYRYLGLIEETKAAEKDAKRDSRTKEILKILRGK